MRRGAARTRARPSSGLAGLCVAGALALSMSAHPADATSAAIPGASDPAASAMADCRRASVVDPRAALDAGGALLARQEMPAGARVALIGCLLQASRMLGDAAATTRLLDAMAAATQAPDIVPRVRNRGRLMAAAALQDLGQVDDALAQMRDVRATARAEGDAHSEIGALIAIAQTYDTQYDDGEAAIAHLDEALALVDAIGGPPGAHHAVLHFNHGDVLLRNGRHAEARTAFELAEGIATGAGGQDALLQRVASGRAELLAAGGQPREAARRFRAILAEQESLGDVPGQVVTLQRLARSLLELGRPRDARVHAERSLAMAREGRMRLHERDGHTLMIQVSSALGDREAVARHAQALRESAREATRDHVARELAQIEAGGDATPSDAPPPRGPRAMGAAIAVLLVALLGSAVLLARARRRQKHLARLGATDALTGLLNRREATRLVAAALAARGRGVAATALLIIDVDHFKDINDRHGHVAGDVALAAIATCLREACAPGDILARWGGEEFVLFRPGADAREASILAERLRRRIERLPMQQPNGVRIAATVSIGVSTLPLFEGGEPSLADSMRAADRAMYEAKHGGRNAWAVIRGLGDGEGVDLGGALDNPALAASTGLVEIVASRDLPWLPLGATRERRDGFGPGPTG